MLSQHNLEGEMGSISLSDDGKHALVSIAPDVSLKSPKAQLVILSRLTDASFIPSQEPSIVEC
jgi:hypothetical protein